MNSHWHIIITQSPYFTLWFTVGDVQPIGLDKCIMTCIHYYGITCSIFTIPKFLCVPTYSSFPTPTKSLATTDLVFKTVSTVLSFPECHIVETTQYIVSSNWLLSFTNMHFNFLMSSHGLIAHAFLLLNNIPLSRRTSWLLPNYGDYE